MFRNVIVERDVNDSENWRGRFPRNENISLPDVNRRFNLAEGTRKI